MNTSVNIELGNSSTFQLYNLKNDIGQQKNVASQHPEKLKKMLTTFEKIRGENYTNVEELELK
jgi:hypothetical protein